MANDIAPAFVQLRYQTSYGLHTMSIPTREYTVGATTSTPGTFPRWSDDGAIASDTMINFLVEALQDGFHTSTTIIDATVFTKTAGENNVNPVTYQLIGLAGLNTSADWRKATQMTLTFRTEFFGTAKLVTLDTPHAGFDRFVPGAASAWVQALAAVLMDEDFAWSGRDGGQVTQWLQGTVTLNEALRKSYGMT